ncbi:MAG: RNA polymerase sigma factor RpoD/SigA [Sphingobacteriales bacterium]|nr:RNA polymerase sigma factor RpoD/SigA [Sphingobacteriales bacterium]NCT72893.1 RNA polymerase sigma factor RpoD/SigA [Chitinophagaceae bacterium]OJW30197.1 MAG: RNA polymerase subunit sigma [Sphingobacteriales bacterium 46-32]
MRQLKITNSITNREASSLDKYLQEIAKVEMISAEEEVRLASLIKKGDKNALDRLTRANLRFVVSVAKQYQGQGLSLPDLINEGNLGLIKAAQRFDDTRGFKFISFAVWWIRQYILQALAENSRMIRLPLNKVALSGKIQRTQSELEQQLERAPSTEELAEALDVNVDDINNTLRHKNGHISLDSPVMGEDEDGSLIDMLVNQNADRTDGELYGSDSLKQEIGRSLQILNAKQKQTICYYFGINVDHPLSLEDIARRMDLTPERVRQIKDKALMLLRNTKNTQVLRSYLGA